MSRASTTSPPLPVLWSRILSRDSVWDEWSYTDPSVLDENSVSDKDAELVLTPPITFSRLVDYFIYVYGEWKDPCLEGQDLRPFDLEKLAIMVEREYLRRETGRMIASEDLESLEVIQFQVTTFSKVTLSVMNVKQLMRLRRRFPSAISVIPGTEMLDLRGACIKFTKSDLFNAGLTEENFMIGALDDASASFRLGHH